MRGKELTMSFSSFPFANFNKNNEKKRRKKKVFRVLHTIFIVLNFKVELLSMLLFFFEEEEEKEKEKDERHVHLKYSSIDVCYSR